MELSLMPENDVLHVLNYMKQYPSVFAVDGMSVGASRKWMRKKILQMHAIVDDVIKWNGNGKLAIDTTHVPAENGHRFSSFYSWKVKHQALVYQAVVRVTDKGLCSLVHLEGPFKGSSNDGTLAENSEVIDLDYDEMIGDSGYPTKKFGGRINGKTRKSKCQNGEWMENEILEQTRRYVENFFGRVKTRRCTRGPTRCKDIRMSGVMFQLACAIVNLDLKYRPFDETPKTSSERYAAAKRRIVNRIKQGMLG